VFSESWGVDTLLADISGIDSLDLAGTVSNITVNLANASTKVTSGSNTISWSGTWIEEVITGWGNDTLTGDDVANLLNAGAGTDTLIGAGGNDTLTGGSGNDNLDGGSGDDRYVFASGWGADTITGDLSGVDTVDFSTVNSNLTVDLDTTGTEVQDLGVNNTVNWSGTFIENVTGGNGNDSLTGNSGNNRLEGLAGADTLTGEAGNDIMVGGTGNDTLNGGANNDTYLFAKGDGIDTVAEVSGVDKVLFDSTVTQSTVAFFKTLSGDLQMGYTNSAGDKITIQGFDTTGGKVESLQLDTGYYITDAEVNQVISDMASYATTNSVSFTSLDDVKNNAGLLAIVNGSWHS
jgi:Ca2+-binding RTX toxin-like protein